MYQDQRTVFSYSLHHDDGYEAPSHKYIKQAQAEWDDVNYNPNPDL